MHAKSDTIKTLVANIRAALQHVRVAAEQLVTVDRWATLLRYICQRIAPPIPQKPSPIAIAATG
jgi:hypothetical protein